MMMAAKQQGARRFGLGGVRLRKKKRMMMRGGNGEPLRGKEREPRGWLRRASWADEGNRIPKEFEWVSPNTGLRGIRRSNGSR